MASVRLLACLLVASACAAPAAPAFDASRASRVVIGRSSRADVFATLGRPARTEQSGAGETWVYEAKPAAAPGLSGTAGAAAGVVGAFVPYVGLVGPSLTLAGAARGPGADAASLSISFGSNGVVRDCLFATTAAPAGLPGAAAAEPIGCAR